MTNLTNDVYGRTVSMETDGDQDVYWIGGGVMVKVPTGTSTPAAYVAIARQGKIAQFQAAMQDFANAKYSIDIRQNFIALYINAQLNSLTNRMAYIAQVFAFQNSVIGYMATFIATVQAATNPATIAAMQWDFSQIAADPEITTIAAVSISN